MNKKGQLALGVFFVMLVIAVVGIALFSSSADTVGQMTKKQAVSNQSVSVVTAFIDATNVNETFNYTLYTQSAWKVIDCPLTSVVVRNGAGTELVADTDYTLDANNARYSLLNTTDTIPETTANLTYADYSHCADGYNKDSGSRTMANLILLFFALAISLAILEKTGLTNMTGFFN